MRVRWVTVCLVIVSASAFGRALTGQSPVPAGFVGNAALSGTVVDASLHPIENVDVTLSSGTTVVARRRTTADGAFAFDKIATGTYEVRAVRSGFQNLTRTVTLSTAGVTRLRLALVPEGFSEERQEKVADTSANDRMTSVVQGIPRALPPSAAPVPAPPAGSTASVGNGRGGAVAREQLYLVDEVRPRQARPSGETYTRFESNRFQRTLDEPLSTFSADVDTASYSNVRRYLQSGRLPPTDAVRVEEFINYFRLSYPGPRTGNPIGIVSEVGDCPWAPGHRLVLVGAQAHAARIRDIEGRNIVLLVDVSGSMAPENRLPLIKTALSMFVDTLQLDDRLAIVTYAGQSGVALPSTPARQRERILNAIRGLGAGGSTNGGQGLVTAYRIARDAFIPGGVNRVVLATDGDFNVGVVGHSSLTDLIERERRSGVFLSVLGVGEGNLKDATMEMLADKGNGHYAYIDTLQEARRVLINEGSATLETVAKDVKFQVEFNPAAVTAWKLIGYENRALAAEDFNNDRKDAGEMGAGHSVTVLYEVIPPGVPVTDDDADLRPGVDPLKYQESRPEVRSAPRTTRPAPTGEIATVKVRYKQPDGVESALIQHVVRPTGGRTIHLHFVAAVADFGILLRSERPSLARWDGLVARLKSMTPPPSAADDFASFRELVDLARGITRTRRDLDQ